MNHYAAWFACMNIVNGYFKDWQLFIQSSATKLAAFNFMLSQNQRKICMVCYQANNLAMANQLVIRHHVPLISKQVKCSCNHLREKSIHQIRAQTTGLVSTRYRPKTLTTSKQIRQETENNVYKQQTKINKHCFHMLRG